jgi:hypothetical protein
MRAQSLAADRAAQELAWSAEGYVVCVCCWAPLEEEVPGIACCGSALLALGALARMLVWYCVDKDQPFAASERGLTIVHVLTDGVDSLQGAA